MKKILKTASTITTALALMVGGQALASPAQDLFDQATFYIGFYYNGPSKVPYFRELRKQYQPKLDAACGNDKNCAYDKAMPIIQEILAGLKDPFTTLVTEDDAIDSQRFSEGKGPAAPRLGVLAREIPGKGLVVIEAYPGEPASLDAGMLTGDLIQTLNGKPATNALLRELELTKQPIAVAYSRKGSSQTINLTARTAEEGMTPRRTLVNGVSVIRIPNVYGTESSSVGERVHVYVARGEQDKNKGFVLDLRDCNSGFDSEGLLAASAFAPGLGYSYAQKFGDKDTYRYDKGRVFLDLGGSRRDVSAARKPVTTNLPVVVLVNQNTVNTCEMIAYWLQKAGRAKIVGTPTAGQLSVSGGIQEQLINGLYFQVSSLRMLNLDGSIFADRVTPDVVVQDDLEALVNGKDVVLEKALELIK